MLAENVSYHLLVLLVALIAIQQSLGSDQAKPDQPGRAKVDFPEDFPRFLCPGDQPAMDRMREMFALHYPGCDPKSTLWDQWLPTPALWPAVESQGRAEAFRRHWAEALSARDIDAEGYVATHQHASFAHQQGWPFPWYTQVGPGAQVGSWGWHFGAVPSGRWHKIVARDQTGWVVRGAADGGISNECWNIELNQPGATVQTPPLRILAGEQAPFLTFRWKATGLVGAQPFVEWTTADAPEFHPDRRMYFDPVADKDGVVFTMIPAYLVPAWEGEVTSLRINFGNTAPAKVGIQALHTSYDTRQNVNNQAYISGCCRYVAWTGDRNFLRANIQRMRLAMRHLMTVHGGLAHKCIVTPWVGHDGRSGLEIAPDGRKIFHPGRGIGNNYWDLLPFGGKDTYATLLYYDALRNMAEVERVVSQRSGGNIPAGPLALDSEELLAHAREVKATAGQELWNPRTGRFVAAIDCDGNAWDYGFTFLSLEAVYYGFATTEQAKSILDWVAGRRIVEGDTSTGRDIYHWRFAPRATTRRNVDYYLPSWTHPESIPWGGQVQDGGAVLGWSYHDLMARLAVLGPDDAAGRLAEIAQWFEEVQQAGGYRPYYKDGTRGSTLQGGGTAGGLGLDCEFFESVLPPQVLLEGFVGFRPRLDGFEIRPAIPKNWGSLTVTRVAFRRQVLTITVGLDGAEIAADGPADEPYNVYLPNGRWSWRTGTAGGDVEITDASPFVSIDLAAGGRLDLRRKP